MKIKLSNLPTEPCSCCHGTGKMRSDAAIGELLAGSRKVKGVTLRELARRMGISVGYLSDLEHGRKAWSDDRIRQYARNIENVEIE